MKFLVIIVLLTASAAASGAAASGTAASGTAASDRSGREFFEQKIRPLFVDHCYRCHSIQAKQRRGGLLLDSKAGWEQGGDSGEPAIIPGQPEASLLLRVVQHREEGRQMPPDQPKLSEAAIADLAAWVTMGAPDPRDGPSAAVLQADKSWWSLRPLATEFVHAGIDGFIEEKLAEKGLTQNSPADPRSLIRRMTYNLTGLPPSPADVDAFRQAYQADARQAITDLADRLLASPRYGEKFGRHWLDVVRYGESNGFERNFVIDDLWPFRDYVIRSLNEDKPFDQFLVEHLAGDVVGRDNPEIEVGTAFLVAGPFDDVGNQDVVAQKNIRAATLDDMITATSGAFLGLTVNCARCHDHKFDPIPSEDYYRMRAAFEGVRHGRRVIATRELQESVAAATQPLREEQQRLEAALVATQQAVEIRARAAAAQARPVRPRIDRHGTTETFEPVAARYLRFVIRGFTDDYPAGSPVGTRRPSGQGGRLTEFQVWNASDPADNVALASRGTLAAGARSAAAEDFPDAYGPQYCIDGMTGEAWFIGDPAVLTLTFPQTQTISGITFINARGDRSTDDSKVGGSTPCEYTVEVSCNGENWRTVASDDGREPWSPEHGLALAFRRVVTPEETEQIERLNRSLTDVRARLSQASALPQVWAGQFTQPTEPTFVHRGGDPLKPGAAVNPGSLSVLDQVTVPFELEPDAAEGQRRLALARWMTAPDNPLTPRVLANRIWQWHFGTGLVDTPSDFGFSGSRPTHPELLDYLAHRLVAGGWKLKSLQREILLSRTWQQSAVYREDAAREDRDARLLWRFPPRRLTAEELRDTMLSVAGQLQLEPMGGPGFRLYRYLANNVSTYVPLDTHGPETYRRAVYHQNARASVVDLLSDFDLPDIAFAAPSRATTTTPLQALTLLNHSFTQDMAAAMARRIDSHDAIGQAWSLALQREPTPRERAAAAELVAVHGPAALCRALLNAGEVLYLE